MVLITNCRAMQLPASCACRRTALPCIVPPATSITCPNTALSLGARHRITPHQHSVRRGMLGCQLHVCATAADTQQASDSAAAAANDAASNIPQLTNGALLLGFALDDLRAIHENLDLIFPDVDPDGIGFITQPMSQQHVSLLTANITPLGSYLDAVSDSQDDQGTSSHHSGADTGSVDGTSASADLSVYPDRVVYLFGEAAGAAGAFVNDLLVQMSIVPCIVGCLQPRHVNMIMRDVCDALRASHARYWNLVRPMAVSAPVDQLLQSFQATQQHQQPDVRSDHHVLEPLANTAVTLAAVLDAGEVPSSAGGWRRDEAHLVVLDGLVTEQERQELLDWLTEPGHDHDGPPPDSKWEQACVDREGAAPSWGLKQDVLHQLETDPPPVMMAIQTRLAALYPEYTLCHMPADVLSASDEEGALSSFVGNAVLYGDPCAWHDDADPAILPPSSPWVHCYGYYYNREAGKPRFVTGLLYLNDAWAEELHAETMFLDPMTQTGVFTRPSPGRVLLMDQDMSHRICSPSQAAGTRPRYSLVWKMVWLPRNDPTLPVELRSCNKQQEQQRRHQQRQQLESQQRTEPGLCRPEWGSPLRIGSTNALSGQPAWKRAG